MDTPIENKAPTWIPTMSNNTIFLWCFTDWTALLLLLHQVESFFALPPLARSHFTSSIIIIVKSYNCYCVFWLLFSSRCVFWFRLLYVLLRLVFMLFLLLHLSECRHAIRSIFTVWLNVISRSLALSGFCCECALALALLNFTLFFLLLLSLLLIIVICSVNSLLTSSSARDSISHTSWIFRFQQPVFFFIFCLVWFPFRQKMHNSEYLSMVDITKKEIITQPWKW